MSTKPGGEFTGSWDANLLETLTTPQEVVLSLEDGSALPLDLIFSPLIAENGKDKEFLVVGRNLSTIRRLEEKLRQQAMIDELTGLFNQRHFLEILDRETLRARRSKRPLGLIFFDLDRFKHINDTRGHQAGDEVLRDIGQLLRKIVRKGMDFPARYGGDEFAVLANEAEKSQLFHLAQRIKNAVDEHFQGAIGLSLGLTHFEPQESPQQFLYRADRASYAAKQAGGGRIVTA
jgi:diguanylate cyclase (GGDEF)-like protein